MGEWVFEEHLYKEIEECHDPEVINPSPGQLGAITWHSNYLDEDAFNAAGGHEKGISESDYSEPTECANTIDLCAWYLKLMEAAQWPIINEAAIKMAMSKDLVNAIPKVETTPVERALETFGSTLLHEARPYFSPL